MIAASFQFQAPAQPSVVAGSVESLNPPDRRGWRKTVTHSPRGNPIPSARGHFRGRFNAGPGLSIKLSPQACKHPGNSFVQSFHERSSSAHQKAREVRHGLPIFSQNASGGVL